ncbi:hypothetical protein A2765_02775 [Candidatus Kaiserbacteria bacterium RIFCSPHIGHO2_01_FULL_56_24]|uniref:Uncharacterized protein n=1 Tax=Candidatus Kaiserbacteria bacterium RIFCSPHIGHO2_01_FULL_56_24 TaxID=1798487 RepID=A0A1F6DC84_9BACT|nr:MAG: hypothetical protein A2765_02775 [Candidatus Kaiserbacteria bacterium RIFCSPHIGHO2_01_FULL_56_24]
MLEGVIVIVAVEPEFSSFIRDSLELQTLVVIKPAGLASMTLRSADRTSMDEPLARVTLKLPLSTVIDSNVALEP